MDNNQRLLKIVNTEDNGEVTIVLQPDPGPEATITRQGQDGNNFLRQTGGSLQNPKNTRPQSSSGFQLPAQPVFGPYQSTSNSQTTHYQASQQLLNLRQLQLDESKSDKQRSNIQMIGNQNKQALTTTTFVTSSSESWNSNNFSTWTPKLGSIKWPQQELDLLQQSHDPVEPRNKNSTADTVQATNSSAEIKIKSSVPSIYPLKFSRVGNAITQSKPMTSILPNTSSLGRIDNFPEIAQISNTSTNVSSPVPINLSNVVLPTNHGHTQLEYNVREDIKPLCLSSSGYSDTSGEITTASPVYKSKLEKAVEQQQQSSFLTSNKNVKSSSAYASTLKKLLGGSIGDIDTLKLLQSFDWKPHIEQLVDQNNQSLVASQCQTQQVDQPTQIAPGTQTRNLPFMGSSINMRDRSHMNSHPELTTRLQAGFNASSQPNLGVQMDENKSLNFKPFSGISDHQQMSFKIDQTQIGGYQDLYTGNQHSADLKKPEYNELDERNQYQMNDTDNLKFPEGYESSSQAKYSVIADENTPLQIANYSTQEIQTQLGANRRQTIESYLPEDKSVGLGQDNQFQNYHESNYQSQIAKDAEPVIQSRVDKTISIGQNYQLQIESYHEQRRQNQIEAGMETASQNLHQTKLSQNNVSKRVSHRSGRTLQSKKDILLDKTQADMIRMSQSQTLQPNDNSVPHHILAPINDAVSHQSLVSNVNTIQHQTIASYHNAVQHQTFAANDNKVPQQSLPNIDFLPDMNFNQLEPQFQNEMKNIETKDKEIFDGTNQNNYQYTLKEADYDKVANLRNIEYQQPNQPMVVYSNEFPATPSLTDIVNEGIKEKEYYSSNWGDKILNEQWRLREEGYFCDAVFFCKEREFKFHRLVMSAVCRSFLYRNHNFSAETQLVLPVDILYENVYIFMKYVYLGNIKLTVNNVQQIYRLSSMFDVSELNTCCYHFCKWSKMGHLIISSPYQESAKQVYRPQFPCKDDKDQFENPTNETSLEITDVGTIEQIADILTKKSNDRKVDTHGTDIDFDWLSFDPDQSNIPIRKRGRNRQKHALNVSDISNKTPEKQEISKKAVSESNNLHASENPKTEDANNKGISPVIKTKDAECDLEEIGPNARERSTENEKDSETINENTLTIPFEELPDPLATGKFDETKLIRRKQVTKPKSTKDSSFNDDSTRKAMVTRYRGRLKTMSVIEAALHKKAKYNMSTPSISTKKERQREKVQLKKKLKSKTLPEEDNVDEVENKMIDDALEAMKKDKNKKNMQADSKIVEEKEPMHHVLPVKNSPPKKKAVSAKKKSSSAKEQNDRKTENTVDKRDKLDTDTEEFPSEPSTSKKPKLRKTTLDQKQDIPLKDPVYMRPPKKRTKEIREMMKNVNDVSVDTKQESQLKYTGISAELKEKLSEEQLKSLAKARLLAEFKQKKQKKSKLLQDAEILRVVYEVEQYGRDIDGEKQYKCCLCSSTFVFSKRAITHIVNTHDISLEETVDYIDVEHRKPQAKKCDICGYITKEINIYYIHFHKYFKHGVPLPKGWQPFKCDFCKKEFFTKFQLREHKLTHFEDNPFVCELCGNGFKSRTGLNSHMFHKHSSVRKHKCPDCSKSFKTRTQMKVHKRTHTGEKPYGCKDTLCNYRSTTRGNMKLHLLNRHKFTTENVEKYMKELKASRTIAATLDALINDPTDSLEEAETDPENMEGQESELKVKIERLDDDNVAFETLVGTAADIANSSKDFPKSEFNFEQNLPSTTKSSGQAQVFPDEIVLQIVDNSRTDGTSQNFYQIETSKTCKPQSIPRQVDFVLHQNQVPIYNTPFSVHQIQLSDNDPIHFRSQTKSTNPVQIVAADINRNKKSPQNNLHSKEARTIVRQDLQTTEEDHVAPAVSHSSGNESLFRRVGGLLVHPQLSFSSSVNNNQPSITSKEQLDPVNHHKQGLDQSRYEKYLEMNRTEVTSESITAQSKYESGKHGGESPASFAPLTYKNSSHNEIEIAKKINFVENLKIEPVSDSNVIQGQELISGQDRKVINNKESQPTTVQLNSNEEHLQLGFYQDAYQLDNF